ncbi:MAG: hypothetical protein WCI21_02545 [Alphaproteobacteria bacterium]
MHDFIVWLQNSAVGTWVREAFLPFPIIISIHVLGMGLVAGTAFASGLRLLGIAPGIPLAQIKRLRLVCIGGLFLIVPSGLLLFISYPAKAITNPMFYIKLTALAVAIWVTWFATPKAVNDPALQAGPLPGKLKVYGICLIAIWAVVIISGRLLPYTYDFNNILWYP